MFDKTKFSSMKPYSLFKYWFTRISGDGKWLVSSASLTDTVTYDEHSQTLSGNNIPECTCDEVNAEFEAFRSTRPEYWVGRACYTDRPIDAEYSIDLYETLIVGVAFIRAKSNGCEDPDDIYAKISPCLAWLRTTDFYTAPASSVYHESYSGGLVHHTLTVVDKIVDLLSTDTFACADIRFADAVLVALVHDWCKINQYEHYMKNVKNEGTGVWEKVSAFRRKDELVPLGHGVASMYYASRFFKLSKDEALAIRWHMGAWRVCSSEYNELQHANETCPLVHLLQFADQLSITKY